MTLGEQIAQLRKQKQMSQEELAAALQLSRQAVSKWENGVSNPDTENLIRLAEIFEVDVNVLIGSQLEGGKDVAAPIPQEQPPDQRKTVRLLSVLLAVAVCTTVLFGTLWAAEKFKKEDMEAIIENESRWDSVKLYNYVGLNELEIPLTEDEQEALASLVWNYRFTEKTEEDTQIIYGGLHAKLSLEKNGVTYLWTFTPQTISFCIKLTDGYTLQYEYESDSQVITYLLTFIKKG